MRVPNHIILTFNDTSKLNSNWLLRFLFQKNTLNVVNDFVHLNKLLKPKNLHWYHALKDIPSHSLVSGKNFDKLTFDHQPNIIKKPINERFFFYNTFSKIFSFFKKHTTKTSLFSDPSHNLININFLRKERLYTKLKYSRSPAYDIVSGGSAALLAGFIGFLISEKYGFEMVDSGDFYYLFMYLVFLSFSLRPLLTAFDLRYNFLQLFSLKIFTDFYLSLFYLLLYFFKY